MTTVRFVAIGDSFTEGVGDERPDGSPRGWADLTAEGWATALEEPIQYANLAIRGRLAWPVVDEQLEDALALRPTHLSFNGGGNDMLRPGTKTERIVDAFVTVADAGKNKSFPDIFLQSAQRLGVSPAACAVFEDNGRALVAAKQAGMHTCAVYDGQPEAAWSAICADADLVLYDLRRCGPFAAESDETMWP